jgi:hypothetical protein
MAGIEVTMSYSSSVLFSPVLTGMHLLTFVATGTSVYIAVVQQWMSAPAPPFWLSTIMSHCFPFKAVHPEELIGVSPFLLF